MQGYELIYTADMRNYCYPVSAALSCGDLDDNAFKEGMVLCNQCSSGESLFMSFDSDTFVKANTC